MGDEWATAFRSHYVELVRACTLIAGDQALAEDAVVNAFTKVFGGRKRRRALAIANPPAYLRVAAVNETRRLLRRDQRRTLRELRVTHREPGLPSDPSESAVDERHVLQQALTRLPYRQRAVVVLREITPKTPTSAPKGRARRATRVTHPTNRAPPLPPRSPAEGWMVRE